MASVRIILKKDKRKDGTYPLVIRITKDRKSSHVYLDYSIMESDWDSKLQRVKKSHPNFKRLNNFLLKKLAEANDQSLELESSKTMVSAIAVRQKIVPSAGSSFFAQADLYLERLKADGKYNIYTPDKSRLNHFKEFLKHDHAFQDITIPLLERFKSYVKAVWGQSERSAVNHLVVIRSVFSQAIKEGATDAKYYPFGKGRIAIRFPESIKVGLNAEEIKALETVDLNDNPKANHARNLWLFSFYFAGMRVSDVLRLRWSDFQNDRLHYAMGKNAKAGSLKVPEKALRILDQYRPLKENNDDLVFPELKGVDFSNKFVAQRTSGFKTSTIDKILKNEVAPAAKIDKVLTMHIARHTFGNISGDKIPIQMLQKLYRHSSIVTTIGYQANFIHKDADEALESVIGA